ncbi:MAG: hypothetical protein O3C60_15880 [Planctomycetota bacterium]|nr:hypothetical protein [Planctomycetota bacterium]
MTEPEKNHWLSLASLLGARSSTPSPSAKSELAAKKAAAVAPPAVVPPQTDAPASLATPNKEPATKGAPTKPKAPPRHWHNLAAALGLEVPSPPPEAEPIAAELVGPTASQTPPMSQPPTPTGVSRQGSSQEVAAPSSAPRSAPSEEISPRGERGRDDRHSRGRRGGGRSGGDRRPTREDRPPRDAVSPPAVERPQGSSDRAPVSPESPWQGGEAISADAPVDQSTAGVNRDQRDQGNDRHFGQGRGGQGRGNDSRRDTSARGGSGRGSARPQDNDNRERSEPARDETISSGSPRMGSGDDEIVWTVWSEEGDAANLDELAAIDFGPTSLKREPTTPDDYDSNELPASTDDEPLSEDSIDGDSNRQEASERGPGRPGSRRRRRRRRGSGSGGRDREAAAQEPTATPRDNTRNSGSSGSRPAGTGRGSNQNPQRGRSDNRGRSDQERIFESSGYGSDSDFDVVDDLDEDRDDDLDLDFEQDLDNDLDDELNDKSGSQVGGSRPLDNSDDDELDADDQIDHRRTVRPHVPSWTDTMDLIVNSNIEAHRNAPPYRRGGPSGGGRRGSGGGGRGPSSSGSESGPSGSGGRDGNRRGRRR